jgi:hypothetical protein
MKYDATLDDLIETTTEEAPAFESILFAKPGDCINQETTETPDFFRDLNLDQIVEGITLGKAGYDLKRFFYTPLRDIDAIAYRYEVFHDLEAAGLLESVRSFAAKNGGNARAPRHRRQGVLRLSKASLLSGRLGNLL